MSKARRWVIIVLSLAVLVMIGINMAEKDDTAQAVVKKTTSPIKASIRTRSSITRRGTKLSIDCSTR